MAVLAESFQKMARGFEAGDLEAMNNDEKTLNIKYDTFWKHVAYFTKSIYKSYETMKSCISLPLFMTDIFSI